MAAPVEIVRQPKPRGTARNRQGLYLEVDPETKQAIAAMSARMGISKAAALDLIIRHVPVDGDFTPTWWDGPIQGDDADAQGSLDLAI